MRYRALGVIAIRIVIDRLIGIAAPAGARLRRRFAEGYIGGRRRWRQRGEIRLLEAKRHAETVGKPHNAVQRGDAEPRKLDSAVEVHFDLEGVLVVPTCFRHVLPGHDRAVAQLLPTHDAAGRRIEIVKQGGDARLLEVVFQRLKKVDIAAGKGDIAVAAYVEPVVIRSVERHGFAPGQGHRQEVVIAKRQCRAALRIGRQCRDIARRYAVAVCAGRAQDRLVRKIELMLLGAELLGGHRYDYLSRADPQSPAVQYTRVASDIVCDLELPRSIGAVPIEECQEAFRTVTACEWRLAGGDGRARLVIQDCVVEAIAARPDAGEQLHPHPGRADQIGI